RPSPAAAASPAWPPRRAPRPPAAPRRADTRSATARPAARAPWRRRSAGSRRRPARLRPPRPWWEYGGMAAELIEIDEARGLVLEHARPLPGELVPLLEALGRVLAEDVTAAEDVPGFDNSAMDGFAVLAADTDGARSERPVELTVVGESRAGSPAGS